jgi:hypothetical protein
MDSETKAENVDSIILEEEIDPNYVPSESEVLEYAQWLGKLEAMQNKRHRYNILL